jgi:hypothetical protein
MSFVDGSFVAGGFDAENIVERWPEPDCDLILVQQHLATAVSARLAHYHIAGGEDWTTSVWTVAIFNWEFILSTLMGERINNITEGSLLVQERCDECWGIALRTTAIAEAQPIGNVDNDGDVVMENSDDDLQELDSIPDSL